MSEGRSVSDSAKRAVRGRSGGWCEVRWGDGCTQIGESLHHLHLHHLGGNKTSFNLVHACNWCHVELHRPANEAEAIARGLIRTTKGGKASRQLAVVVGADAVAWMHAGGPQPRAPRRTRPVRVGERVVDVDAVDWTATERADELLEVLGLRTARMAHAAA